jgi:hydrophobe/amphiphile efflux-3 (HAE3) family protein
VEASQVQGYENKIRSSFRKCSMDHLADLFARHRGLLASLVLIATCVASVGLSRLRIDSDPRAMLNARDLLAEPLRKLEEDFGASDADCVIVLAAADFITPPAVAVVSEVVARIQQMDDVERVMSLLSIRGQRRVGRYYLPLVPSDATASATWFEEARASAAGHPLLGRLLSEDRSTTLVIARLSGSDHSEATLRRFVTKLKQIVSEVTRGSEVSASLTGLPVLRVEMIGSLMRDQLKFNITAMCAASSLCMLMFRSLYSTLLVMLSSSIGVIWTLGTMGWLGVPINMITSVIAPLVLVIGVSDAIHLHLEMRRARAIGMSKLQAAQAGIRHVGLACALTSLTTCIGFGSLRLASLDVIRVFGTWSALGCILNYLAVITVLPLLTTAFPDKALVGNFRLVEGATSRLTPLLIAITRRRQAIVLTAVFVTTLLFMQCLKLQTESQLTETIAATQPAYQALHKCDEQFGGGLPASVLVEWTPEQAINLIPVLTEVHAAFDRQPHIHNPASLLNLLKSLPGSSPDLRRRIGQLKRLPEPIVHQFLNADGNRALVQARIPDVGSRTLDPEFDALEHDFSEIVERYPGFSVELTGGSVLSFRNLRLVARDLWRSLSAAAIVIIIVLSLAFRSLGLGAISALPNIFPLVCAASALALTGRPLETSSVVVFSMCLGIATDDTIHFLARFQHERTRGATPSQAVNRTIEVVGEAILVTTVLLTIGFASFMLSQIPALQNVGQLACVALVTALLGDLVILPSLLLFVYDHETTDNADVKVGIEAEAKVQVELEGETQTSLVDGSEQRP